MLAGLQSYYCDHASLSMVEFDIAGKGNNDEHSFSASLDPVSRSSRHAPREFTLEYAMPIRKVPLLPRGNRPKART